MNKRKLVLMALLSLSFGMIGSNVYSDEGGGGGSGGTSASCSNNALTSLCGSPAGSAGGGASWKIFKADDGWGLDDWTGYGGGILDDSYKGEAMRNCSDEGWFASFGWDGMKGSHYGYSDYNFQIGPATRTDDDLVSIATYNNYDTASISWLEDSNHYYPNNTRISSGTALELYRRLHPGASGIPDGVGYFCVPTNKTLTVYARVNGSGAYLNDGKPLSKQTVRYKSSVWAESSWFNPQGYTFSNWGISESDMRKYTNTSDNTTRDIMWKSLEWDQDLDAYYDLNIFEGQSILSGAASAVAGYTRTNDTKYGYVYNCSPVDGCKVSFEHKIKRVSGGDSSGYTISRTANMITSSRKISPTGTVKTGYSSNPNGETVSSSGEWTLYPGMVVCEKMTFMPYTLLDVGQDAYTEVCAFAFGDAQLSGDTSFINIEVRNSKVSKYSNYQREVYAKPTDILNYRATYNPVLQYTYYLKPGQMQIDGGTIHSNSGSFSSWNNTLGTMFNWYKSPGWNNGFSIQRSNSSNNFASGAATIQNHTYAAGSTDKQSPTPNNYTVALGDVGKSIDERAITNLNSTTQTTPSQVSFPATDSNLSNVSTATKSKIAYARIPYNFTTGVSINTADSTPVYAGEKTIISYTFDINPKTNSYTTSNSSEKYATYAKQVIRKLVVYNPDTVGVKSGGIMTGGRSADVCATYFGRSVDQVNCGYGEDIATKDFTDVNLQIGKRYATESATFYAQDKMAGQKVCVAMAVFPASSGADTNWNNLGYSGSWRISNSKCYTIAKKPSIQVWGGNVYSSGDIKTITAKKNTLSGYNSSNYKTGAVNKRADNKGANYMFGSWTELGIVSNGKITGFSSGSSLGYGGISNGTLSPNPFVTSNTASNTSNPGGSATETNCNRSPLTFANNCTGDTTPAIGNSVATGNAKSDKTALVSKYIYGNNAASVGGANYSVSGSVSLNDSKKRIGDIYYYFGKSSLTIPQSTVSVNTIQVVHSMGNITINGDITYNSSATYRELSTLPKLVIYAEQNIYINCNVSRIDAILIAGKNSSQNGEVRTCVTSTNGTIPGVDTATRAKQLKINGAVVANKLTPSRTYGAATGANSMIPAEIINFDPTLYLWGGDDTDDSGGRNTNVDITYSKELAPRY